jgi:3-hydroxyisobutyrate dehydrogenase-like beta-hydroxyacid dehydrogenase
LTDSRVLGFVGVGRMGGPMASRLLDAGYQLVVFDTNADATAPLAARGARVAASAGDVASLAPIVFVSLPTPPIVQSVALSPGGLISGTARIDQPRRHRTAHAAHSNESNEIRHSYSF